MGPTPGREEEKPRPRHAASPYGNPLGGILCHGGSITESSIRDSGKQNLRELIRRVHARFKFPDEYDNLSYPKNHVNNHAIHNFSKNLSSCKSAARKEVHKDYSVIKDKWPTISEDDWNIFKIKNQENPVVQSQSTWGKDMRSKTLSNHTLGSRGFVGKKPVWDERESILAAKGIPNHFE